MNPYDLRALMFLSKKRKPRVQDVAFSKKNLLQSVVLEQGCLFEEFVEGVNPVVKFYAQALAFAVENRNIPHCPLDASLVEVDDIAVFHVDDLLVYVDGDVRLGGEDENLDLAVDEPADHFRGWREFPAARRRNDLDLKPVVSIPFGRGDEIFFCFVSRIS